MQDAKLHLKENETGAKLLPFMRKEQREKKVLDAKKIFEFRLQEKFCIRALHRSFRIASKPIVK